jgi:endo-beta-N-acetylglucosaminidase D
VIEGGKV